MRPHQLISEWWFDLLIAAAVLWLALTFWSCTANVETVRFPDSQPAVGQLTIDSNEPLVTADDPAVTGIDSTIERPTVNIRIEAGTIGLVCFSAVVVMVAYILYSRSLIKWQRNLSRERKQRNSGSVSGQS